MSDPLPASKSCRHRDTWLIAGGSYEWCYRCGALRKMQETGIAQVTAVTTWLRPVGLSADNPWSSEWANGAGLRKIAPPPRPQEQA